MLSNDSTYPSVKVNRVGNDNKIVSNANYQTKLITVHSVTVTKHSVTTTIHSVTITIHSVTITKHSVTITKHSVTQIIKMKKSDYRYLEVTIAKKEYNYTNSIVNFKNYTKIPKIGGISKGVISNLLRTFLILFG